MKMKLIQLANDRTAALDAAKKAYEADNQAEYNSQMEKVQNLNKEIKTVKDFIAEQERSVLENAPTGAEAHDMAEERGAKLQRGEAVNFSPVEILRDLRNSVTITGTLVQPTGADPEIHGGNDAISSLLDQVTVEDLTGMGSYDVPYVISELEGTVGDLQAKSGQARDNSTDPTFGIARLKPLEVTTTSYIDRNIAKISPANYYEKVQRMALRALRRKAVGLVVNGDGAASPVMYGIKTAKNTAGNAICASQDIASIGVNTLDDLYFAYGADSELGGTAGLLLRKADLKAIGQLRGTNEKGRLFKITPSGNGNTGIISDGGVNIPYTLVPDLGELDLIYGNLRSYMLGLFGGYEIRVDEHVKAIERMHTILGDVSLGGNVVEHHGFVVGKKAE